MNLLLENEQELVPISLKLMDLLKKAISLTLVSENVTEDLEISMLIVDDAAIQAMNKTYRAKDQVTDVLSFPLFEDKKAIRSGDLLGDIVIDASRAKDQAEAYGHSLEREFCFLTVHSMLHLLGYDHEISDEEDEMMVQKQEKILADMGLVRD